MIRRSVSLSLSTGVIVAAMALPLSAHGDPLKQQCVDDNAAAQELRRQGHFADATDRLERCAASSCPEIVRDDCTRRLNELKMAQPSVVFEVRSPAGKDLIGVRVLLDGQPFIDHLDGTPLKVDPGPHVFSFEFADEAPVTTRLLIREGEIGRHERVVIGKGPPPPPPTTATRPTAAPAATAATPPAPPPVAPLAPAVQDHGPGTRQIVGVSAAGLGVAGVVVGTVFGVKARTAWNEAKTACGGDASHCFDVASAGPHRSQAVSDATISTVAFISGAALIAGGALLYLTADERREGRSESVALTAVVTSDQLGIVLRGAFR